MSTSELLWQPSPERVARSQMHEFMQRMADRHGIGCDWESLRRWAIERREVFWPEFLAYAGIELATPWRDVYRGQGIYDCEWFAGAKLNYARHLLRHNDERVALRGEDELGRSSSCTYQELRAEVARCAATLRREGVAVGDRVVGYLPNVPETVIAMLAAASIGAIWSSCSPDFGIGGVLDRFGQIGPKVLFTADGYTYNGKPFDSLERVRGILDKLTGIARVVVVPFLEGSGLGVPNRNPSAIGVPFRVQGSGLPAATSWREFLGPVNRKAPSLTFEGVPFDHPLFIMYSSGTTGVPKCIVHGHGGTLLQHMKELMLHCDLRRGDTIFYYTTCGWMMWNWLVSGLGVGSTVVLYEGSPAPPSAGGMSAPQAPADTLRLWRMADRLGITVFGTSPKFISACHKAEIEPGRDCDLSKLRCVLSTGSPLTVEEFRWVYAHVKNDVQLSSISGGTDIISCFMLGNPMLPVYAGEIQCRGLGMDVHALDEHAQPVIGQKGELVCTAPFPSRPVFFWDDPNHEKYRKAYFDHFPNIWRHGDYVEITGTGGVIVYGRSDATLNPGGVRIGTAEIYRQVEQLPEILDSVVVGKNTPDGDVDVLLFVVLRPGLALDEPLTARIKKQIAEGATKRHVPKFIHPVTDIPRTISGKKVELAITQILHGAQVLNRDALANPESLDQYRRFA